MIVYAHIGHWYGAFGFLVPAALVIVWIRFQARRERRRVQFAERWTLELRDGHWRIVSVAPTEPAGRRRGAARAQQVPSPWSAQQPPPDLAIAAGNGRHAAPPVPATSAADEESR